MFISWVFGRFSHSGRSCWRKPQLVFCCWMLYPVLISFACLLVCASEDNTDKDISNSLWEWWFVIGNLSDARNLSTLGCRFELFWFTSYFVSFACVHFLVQNFLSWYPTKPDDCYNKNGDLNGAICWSLVADWAPSAPHVINNSECDEGWRLCPGLFTTDLANPNVGKRLPNKNNNRCFHFYFLGCWWLCPVKCNKFSESSTLQVVSSVSSCLFSLSMVTKSRWSLSGYTVEDNWIGTQRLALSVMGPLMISTTSCPRQNRGVWCVKILASYPFRVPLSWKWNSCPLAFFSQLKPTLLTLYQVKLCLARERTLLGSSCWSRHHIISSVRI